MGIQRGNRRPSPARLELPPTHEFHVKNITSFYPSCSTWNQVLLQLEKIGKIRNKYKKSTTKGGNRGGRLPGRKNNQETEISSENKTETKIVIVGRDKRGLEKELLKVVGGKKRRKGTEK